MPSRRKKIMMLSEGKLQNGKPTKTVYYTTVSEKAAEKLKQRKFDPRAYNPETKKCGAHVIFNEKKVPK